MSNEVQIPKLGLGSWFIDDDRAADAVRAAIKIGYRNIDSAQAYGNEHDVGEGVRTSRLADGQRATNSRQTKSIRGNPGVATNSVSRSTADDRVTWLSVKPYP